MKNLLRMLTFSVDLLFGQASVPISSAGPLTVIFDEPFSSQPVVVATGLSAAGINEDLLILQVTVYIGL